MAYCRKREQPMEYVLVQDQRKRERPIGIRSMSAPAVFQVGKPGSDALLARLHVVRSKNDKGQGRQKKRKQQEQEPGREQGEAEVAMTVPFSFCEGVDLDRIVFKNRSLLQGAIEEFGLIKFLMLVERWWYSHDEKYYSHPAMESRAWVAAWKQLKPVQPRDIVMGFSANEDILSSSVNNPAMFWEALQRLGIRAFLDVVDLWGRRHNPVAGARNRSREAHIARTGRRYGVADAHSLVTLDHLQEQSDVDYCRSGWMVTTKQYVNGATQKFYYSPRERFCIQNTLCMTTRE